MLSGLIVSNSNWSIVFQYARDYPVIWMKLDELDRHNDLTITTGNTLILNDPRFKIDYSTRTYTYTLSINDIQVVRWLGCYKKQRLLRWRCSDSIIIDLNCLNQRIPFQ